MGLVEDIGIELGEQQQQHGPNSSNHSDFSQQHIVKYAWNSRNPVQRLQPSSQ
jgi:hypothetical protein